MIKFGQRKDGRKYPKIKKKNGKKGTVRNSGKIIKAKGYWARGDSSYSNFAWDIMGIKSIIDRREKFNKQRYPEFSYQIKEAKGANVTLEYFGYRF